MRLPRRSVQRHFAAAAQRHAEGRHHHRLGGKFDGLGHALEAADGQIHLVPIFLLNRHQQQHDVGAYGKMLRVVADDEGVEAVARPARLQRLRNELHNVATQRVHLAVKLNAAHAIAQINQ